MRFKPKNSATILRVASESYWLQLLADKIAGLPPRKETTDDGYLHWLLKKAIRKDSAAKASDSLIASDPSCTRLSFPGLGAGSHLLKQLNALSESETETGRALA